MPSYKPLDCTLKLGDLTISYTWARKAVKNYNMRVRTDGSIYVSTPTRITQRQVEAFIADRADFLRRALARMAARRPGEVLSLAQGEILPICGVSHTVCLLKSKKARVFCEEERLYICLPDPDDIAARVRAFWRFAAAQMTEMLEEMTARYAPQFLPAGTPVPPISLRRMKGRWGSCFYTEGRINYNTRLFFMPVACAEYVVCHELAHFRHHDHSKEFYAYLARVMPDHRARRQLLRTTPVPTLEGEVS